MSTDQASADTSHTRRRASQSSEQDIIDLTSPDKNGQSQSQKRGRDSRDGIECARPSANGVATTSSPIAAATYADSNVPAGYSNKRRRLDSAGYSDKDHEIISLLDDSSDDEHSGAYQSDGRERKSDGIDSKPAAKPASRRNNIKEDSVIELISSPPMAAIDVGSTHGPADGAAAGGIGAGSIGWMPANGARTAVSESTTCRAAADTAAAINAPSPFATSASEYLDSVTESLCHEKKSEHFNDARRPEQLLREEITHLRRQLCCIPDRRSEAWMICQQQINELQSQLHSSRKNAAEDIFNRNNSAGSMGKEDPDGRLVIDFHGLYVKDAKEKYEEMVLPVLPVQRDVAIITGKGRHSYNGRSALRDGLLGHIQNSAECREGKVRCSVDPRNGGRLIIKWLK
mmetsp:Transcript_18145/g.39620  ORF Transcript_18145/g.39620 Transcript_18145/m.39620 type:complete len:401 (-) Transcript_18145:1198-2400(-)|eukprot:CAMPEP_0178488602 /NCGR_PEP_ID=MMETSP0696-20121128/9945_1 /TAXON_ID=265572 /ORGANISM="Extubocellulus spinifer, Strain CCMP396" /LENGTH=400 /DNA_ID=CAMNT_0020116377 /DNA_START=409 /DNA_END=1611 /DNA_ORIENTATION=-